MMMDPLRHANFKGTIFCSGHAKLRKTARLKCEPKATVSADNNKKANSWAFSNMASTSYNVKSDFACSNKMQKQLFTRNIVSQTK